MANAGGWYKASPPRGKVHDNLEVLKNHVAAELVVELTHRRNSASDLDRVIAIAMPATTRFWPEVDRCARVNTVVEVTLEVSVVGVELRDMGLAILVPFGVVVSEAGYNKQETFHPSEKRVNDKRASTYTPS